MNQDELLKLTQIILKEIKTEVLCSHDIISSLELKHIYPREIDNYRKIYPNFAQYIQYYNKIKTIRKIANHYISEKSDSFSSPQAVCWGTITRFGVGECSELVTLAIIKLLKNNCYTIAQVQINAEQGRHDHCFVIIGHNLENLGRRVSSTDDLMQQLATNNSIILDPFLNYASYYTEKNILKTYIKSYNLKKIHRFAIFNETHLTSAINWTRCIDEVYQHLQKNDEIITLLQEEASSKQLLKKYNSSNLERGLRNAAAKGNLEDVKSFCHLLKNNIDAQDNNPESRKTALHWAAIKGHEKCYDFLIASGSNPIILDADGHKANYYLTPITTVVLTR